jgi:glycerophosphoryl diester phosphodiesterase
VALYEGGIRIAEIDVAQLRSGEHILFHDGVWEEKSSGRGAVAQSTLRDVENYLLNDTEGKITASRPVLFADVLAYARGKLHLEIDFKSSADYGEVIDMVRAAGMTDHVVLISYSEWQARRLASLAPEMYISVSAKSGGNMSRLTARAGRNMAWVGKSQDRRFMRALNKAGVTVLSQERGREAPYREADILVSDYALSKKVIDGAIGLSRNGQTDYAACLSAL